MPRKKNATGAETPVLDYRHDTRRKNIPPAGLAAQGMVREAPKIEYAYNPHLPPALRSDPTGESDRLPELLQTAVERKLNLDEVKLLAEALRRYEPWLEWSGKREKKAFVVEPVALHIHERISAQAILKAAQREDAQRSLFADPAQDYREAVQFYQHDVDWSNRMILGDSLAVMASLARREDLAGKVQMIYIDPPYGIKFASNFQPEIGRRDVKDKESDLTREPETVKAYRDTWTLGVHSYLAYLRDRLMLAKELLTDSGSIFVQISDENLHRVRMVMDEVFGVANFICQISVQKTGSAVGSFIQTNFDFLLWYAKDRAQAEKKFKPIYKPRLAGGAGGSGYSRIEEQSGARRPLMEDDYEDLDELKDGLKLWRSYPLTSDGFRETTTVNFEFQGKTFHPGANRHWGVTTDKLRRVGEAERLIIDGNQISLIRYWKDSPAIPIPALWNDLGGVSDRIYVVQTNVKIVERCLLMTTDPGDLVLDPTCGSGTTAYVAEQWGRRWITIDTSRVALALARQRLLTAEFDFYKLRPVTAEDMKRNPNGIWLTDPTGALEGKCTFACKSVPHITLKSIAQNVALDPIFARHQPILDDKLARLNAALKTVTPELRQRLQTKLREKEKREGRRAITDADRRRWVLPKDEWKEWEVPFDTDDDWTPELKAALVDYRAAWRAKMDEVNACIAASAEQEELVDQPEVVRNVARVSGPFTMEAVMPAEESLDAESPIAGEPEELETFGEHGDMATGTDMAKEPVNAEAYLDKMLRLLRADGVRFPNNKVAQFTRLEPIGGGEYLHAEGEWQSEDGQARLVAVSFGPQHGNVTAFQVESALRMASRRGFDELVFAGFGFDAIAQATIQDDPNPKVRCHIAHIRPDVNMGDLLKETPNSQIFTVFGSPRTALRTTGDGLYVIEMQGVDIYNPVDNTLLPTSADKVAAWFLDSDYDGRTFCITQAFFPDKSAWEKLARALKGVVDEDLFAAFSGTVSLPFPAGQYKRAAVKVIDPRGNEVMRVHRLEAGGAMTYG